MIEWLSIFYIALDGELTPIIVQMVKSANTNGLLDNENEPTTKYQNSVKRKLHEILQTNKEFDASDEESLVKSSFLDSLTRALKWGIWSKSLKFECDSVA